MTVQNTHSKQYCALLRGVNVKGTNMKMADVCGLFTTAGMQQVSSVLASGNIIFNSDSDPEALKPLLENQLSETYQYEAHLFIVDKEALLHMRSLVPFEEDKSWHIYCFIGLKNIGTQLNVLFKASKKASEEQGSLVDEHFFWRIPKGKTLDSDFGKVLGRKVLKDQFTSRNLNTIDRIIKKMA